jgi:hypothetical protein
MEFVYDDFVWLLIESEYYVRYVCSTEQLGNQLADNLAAKEHILRSDFDVVRWPITRHYGEIPKHTRAMGQTSKSN